MSMLAKIRNIRRRGARSAFAAGLLAWLALILQPCAMAAPLSGPADVRFGVELSVVTHHGAGVLTERCLHCDTAHDPLFESCDEVTASSQAPPAKPVDPGADDGSPAGPAAAIADIRQVVSRPLGTRYGEDLPRTVSITVACCVYLE